MGPHFLALRVLMVASIYLESAMAMTLSSRLIHRYSEEVRGFRASSGRNVSGSITWPEKRSLEYYRMLASSDFQRQKMKFAPQYRMLFPSEGSKTMKFGNDFGWLHYMWIDIGIPKVSFLVALDSGTDLLWIPCDCVQCAPLSASYYSSLIKNGAVHAHMDKKVGLCGRARNISYKTISRGSNFKEEDRDLNEYSPSASSTSKHVSCSHQLCDSESKCKSPKQHCPYTINYYTENTSSSGLLVEDTLHLASGGDDTLNTSVQASVIIGCGMKQSGSYLDGVAPDGLMGLGLGEIAVPSFLAKSGLIKNSFSMCFNEDGSGRIFFGDKGPVTQQSTPFLPLDGKFITYIVGVEASCVDNSCPKQTSFRALVDSGTSFTFLPDKVFEAIAQEFDKGVNATISTFEDYPWKYCYKTSSPEVPKVPALKLMFSLNNSFVIRDPIYPIYGLQGLTGFCLAVQPADGDIGIIGQNFMTGYRVVFDKENLKLGWSRSKCQDLSVGKGMSLTPPPEGTPPNPLPTNEQQRAPNGHAVSPAVAGRAPSKPSSASTQSISSQFFILKSLLLLFPFHGLVQAF